MSGQGKCGGGGACIEHHVGDSVFPGPLYFTQIYTCTPRCRVRERMSAREQERECGREREGRGREEGEGERAAAGEGEGGGGREKEGGEGGEEEKRT